MQEQNVAFFLCISCINLWLVEAVILDLLEEINAIVTGDIILESKKLIELLSKISEITVVNIECPIGCHPILKGYRVSHWTSTYFERV